jgi:hypothetical protein
MFATSAFIVPEKPSLLTLLVCCCRFVMMLLVSLAVKPHIFPSHSATPEGVYILEVNLSCNLFNGAFDSASYYSLLWHYFNQIGSCVRAASGVGKRKAE